MDYLEEAARTMTAEEFVNDVLRGNRERIDEIQRLAPRDGRGYATQGWIETAIQFWRRVRGKSPSDRGDEPEKNRR